MSKNAIRFPESAIASGRVGTARIREQIAGAAARLADKTPVRLDPAIHALVGSSRSKYGNRRAVVDGITFDSEREAERYSVLALRVRAGEICNLRIQVPFPLVPAATINGRRVRARVYIADFVYEMPHGLTVVEDAKGVHTSMYRLKRQLMKVIHNIEIQEV